MKGILFSLIFFSITTLHAQIQNYRLTISTTEFEGFSGLQSYSFAQYDGKILLVGGRMDGLHQRQPFASFDLPGHNNNLILLDPETSQVWYRSLDELNQSTRAQLRSSNQNFHQSDDILYIIGGYGYSDFIGDHTTFDKASAINVPGIITAILDSTALKPHIKQVTNKEFAVTGGRLEVIDDLYYLVGGQNFEGRYNPMDMPSFVQKYTDEIRIFDIRYFNDHFTIKLVDKWHDAENLHRRDYNVAPQIMPDQNEGLTAFSGVFQEITDLPFLNCVNITSDSFEVQAQFVQYFNHYHCAHIPIYDADQNEMHTYFFGGMAQFYKEDGILVQDNEVPFVKSISKITRNQEGKMSELLLNQSLPAYLGGGSEFIVNEAISRYPNGVLKLNSFDQDSVFLGYIIGGIESSQKNIFWINDGTQSEANKTILKVHLIKETESIKASKISESNFDPQLIVYPNQVEEDIILQFKLSNAGNAKINIQNPSGTSIYEESLTNLKKGKNLIRRTISGTREIPYMIVTLTTNNIETVQKVILY